MYTAHHDRSRCFQETLDGAFSVTVAGAWFPRAVYNRAHAFCAYVRCILIALHIAWVALRCCALPSAAGLSSLCMQLAVPIVPLSDRDIY
jgi:hypothetical protein